jgi:hypothetical protein
MFMGSTPHQKTLIGIWVKKKDLKFYCLQEAHITDRNKYCLRVTEWNIYLDNGPPKQAGVAMLTSDKVDFKPKLMWRIQDGD